MGCVCSRESIAIGDRKFFERSRLGEGGFSYVDLVEDKHSHKLYALKRLNCHSKEDERNAVREVEYMNSFGHRNLVVCEAWAVTPVERSRTGVVSEVLVLMPYYRRGTLQDEVEGLRKRGEHMKEGRLLRLFEGICEGIKALHTHYPLPVTHRDIKPANVLLEDDDTPVLMDFGSMGPAVVDITNLSQAQTLQDLAAERCSMPYRAPELFNVDSRCTIDDRIDIWSLGCTLYAMCFHESPFDRAHQRGDSIALAVLGENIQIPDSSPYSKEVTDMVLAMLTLKASNRPDIETILQRVSALSRKQQNCI
ncbi:Serine/threonine-protein kinase 16 [Lamellibrachia satsuma]|nr:Serine/threonine-protein kinase 16 [Lamellibrachia satsuma]